jgi:hypothetical protein
MRDPTRAKLKATERLRTHLTGTVEFREIRPTPSLSPSGRRDDGL